MDREKTGKDQHRVDLTGRPERKEMGGSSFDELVRIMRRQTGDEEQYQIIRQMARAEVRATPVSRLEFPAERYAPTMKWAARLVQLAAQQIVLENEGERALPEEEGFPMGIGTKIEPEAQRILDRLHLFYDGKAGVVVDDTGRFRLDMVRAADNLLNLKYALAKEKKTLMATSGGLLIVWMLSGCADRQSVGATPPLIHGDIGPTPTVVLSTTEAEAPATLTPESTVESTAAAGGFSEEQLAVLKSAGDLYLENGLPSPLFVDKLWDTALTGDEQIEKPAVIVVTKSEDLRQWDDYENVVFPFLRVGYELVGKDRGLELLHGVRVTSPTDFRLFYCVCVIGNQELNIAYEYPNWGTPTWLRLATIHEWLHLLKARNVNRPEAAVEMFRIEAELMNRFGPLDVFDRLYLFDDPEKVRTLGYYSQIGGMAEFQYANGFQFAKGLFFSEDAKEFLKKEIEQYDVHLVAPDTVNRALTDEERYHVGKSMVDYVLSHPEQLETTPFGITIRQNLRDYVDEGVDALITDIFMGTGSGFATDEVAVDLTRQWLEVATYGVNSGKTIDMDDLRYRLRYPSGETLPYQLP